ncbi:pentapeptide repeat-containing protein [Gloeomargarita lithophora]|uniref:pentapeptide repeat-containing protein n=1 Tax=Gloeomargarita lithophora TaxID=1188228 RepID=UPI003F6EACD5
MLTGAREAAIAEISDWIITSQSIQQAAYADIDAMVEGVEAAGMAEEEDGEETDEELSETDLESQEVADELEGVEDTVELAMEADAPPPDETDVDTAIDELKNTGGEYLPAEIQQQLFQLYGIRDSDKIVIHDDAASYALCENLAAHAATNAEHIFFGEGRYNLDTDEGLQLIYHEVMHTLQHGGTEATEEGMVTDDTLFDLAAHLPGADLAGEDMGDAKMPGFDFTGANLSRVNLKDADLSKALLVNVNLEGADLSGVNLTEADLTGADLTNANLKDADLTKAKLDGTLLPD